MKIKCSTCDGAGVVDVWDRGHEHDPDPSFHDTKDCLECGASGLVECVPAKLDVFALCASASMAGDTMLDEEAGEKAIAAIKANDASALGSIFFSAILEKVEGMILERRADCRITRREAVSRLVDVYGGDV